ncbi:MAG TPA: type VI secretion system accessory protein TagJ [Bryobacteraceae bacterium]|jgi:type VI secretion system protein ImpE|nr:type VI secretion system accessory protein TagJ [Bryobacteraceae bacterium]
MSAQELLQAGKLQDAIQLLSNELRDRPGDNQRRTFLFELLCFAGDYGRAEKHLSLLSDSNADAAIGGLMYRSALSAERKRQAFFDTKAYEKSEPPSKFRPGTINGEKFNSIEDIDPRIGPRLEVFIAGEYVWLPFAHIGSLTSEPPRYLRDLLWASGNVTAGPAMEGKEFGEVLMPVLYPFSSTHPRDEVKLGRETDWILAKEDPLEIPYGQKLFVLDEERSIAILEIRSLQFDDSIPQS